MSDQLDKIVNMQVDIASPLQNSSDFGVMLLIGPPPVKAAAKSKAAAKMPPDVGIYSGLDEVTAAGWAAIGEGADPIGVAAKVAFSQKHPPAHIYIAVQKMEGSELEQITATLDRAKRFPGWCAIAPAGIDESLYESIAAWNEANGKGLFAFTSMNAKNPVTTECFRSFGIFGKVTADETSPVENNRYAHVAWLAEGSSYTPGSETWEYKQLTGITPSVLSSQEIAELEGQNLAYYVEIAGKGCTRNAKVIGGEWIDTIRFRDWLVSDMQTRVFSLLVSNPKVPYNDGGIGMVDNQMIASLKQGQQNGGIDDDAYDAEGALFPGFTTSVPLAASVSDADKAKRVLNDCRFTARLSGAIHAVEIKGNLVYS